MYKNTDSIITIQVHNNIIIRYVRMFFNYYYYDDDEDDDAKGNHQKKPEQAKSKQ